MFHSLWHIANSDVKSLEQKMRINPSEIRVDYGNGQSVTLGSDANWERVREYIDRLFQWDKSYPGDPVVPQEQAVTDRLAEIVAPNAVLDPAPTTLDPNLRIIDRIFIALGKSGAPLSTKEMYRRMVADGYVNKAIKPENNVHSKGRKYPSLIKMTDGVFSLLPVGRKLFYELEQNGFQRLLTDASDASEGDTKDSLMSVERQTPVASDAGFSRKTEVLGGDYLLQALYLLGGSASLDDLIDPMVSFGWRPNSATRIKKKHNVSALAYTNREYVDRNNGRVSLNDKGLKRLVSQGLLSVDGEALNTPYQKNSPVLDLK